MSLLEDRLLRIFELKEQGQDSSAIAQTLQLPENVVDKYYAKTKDNLSRQSNAGKTLEQISSAIGFSSITTEIALRHYNIQLLPQIKMQKAPRENYIYKGNIQLIRKLASTAQSVEEIAQSLGIKPGTVMDYARRENIRLPLKYKSFAERIEEIKTCIASGAEFMEEVAEVLTIHPSSCYNIFLKSNISPLPFRDKRNRYFSINNSAIDIIIQEGALNSLKKIGNAAGGLSGEYIRQYLVGTGQYELWKNAKKERTLVLEKLLSQIDSPRKNLTSQIQEAGLRNASETERRAYEKAREYFHKKEWRKNKFNTLFSLFYDYFQAQQNGEKVSIETFAEKYHLWAPKISRIFKEIGLKPLISSDRKKRVVTSPYKKQCLERAVEVAMSPKDIAYFLQVGEQVPISFFTIWYKGDKQRPNIHSYITKGNRNARYLPCRLASQIYEALDADFSDEEIMGAYTLKKSVFDYALENRQKIAKHIIKSLKLLFPDKPVNAPYITFIVNDINI